MRRTLFLVGVVTLTSPFANAVAAQSTPNAAPRAPGEIGPTPTNPFDSGYGTTPGTGATPAPPKVPSASPAVITTPRNQPGQRTLPAPNLTPTSPGRRADVAPADEEAVKAAGRLPDALTATPGGLTADIAAKRARSTSFSVKAAQATLSAAQAQKAEAGRRMVPTVTLSARYTRLSKYTPGTFPFFNAPGCLQNLAECQADPNVYTQNVVLQQPILNQYAGRASLVVPVSDIFLKLLQFYRAAGHSVEANRLDALVARETASLQGREAFYEYLRAVGQMAVAEQSVISARKRRDDVARATQAGTAARADLLRAEANLADLERLVTAARNGADLAEAQLRQRLHMKKDESIASGEAIDGPVQLPRESLTLLIKRAMEKRPEILSISRNLQAIDANLAATRANQYPSLAATGNLDYANPNPRIFPQTQQFRTTWDVNLQLTWSPNDTLVNDATLSKLQAQRAQLAAQQAAAREGYEMEVRSQWNAVQAAKAQLDASAVAVASAEESFRVRSASVSAGAATLTDLVEADSQLLQARMNLVNANVDVREALARLRRAVGDSDGVGKTNALSMSMSTRQARATEEKRP